MAMLRVTGSNPVPLAKTQLTKILTSLKPKVMAIIKKTDAFPERPVIMTIYGKEGVGKTSLVNTAKNPLLIDCDRGADRSLNRPDTLYAKSWEDIASDTGFSVKDKNGFFIQKPELVKPYDTIVVDTPKTMLDDFLMEYVIRTDSACAKNTQKAYGAIGMEFKKFVNYVRALNKDIIFVMHTQEDKDGDLLKFSPKCTGQSRDLILQISDQVGFFSLANNQRTIFFEPTDRTVGKNVARFPNIHVPNEADVIYPKFMAKLVDDVKGSILKKSEAQAEALRKVAEIEIAILTCETVEVANAILEEMKSLSKIQQTALKPKFKAQYEKEGLTYNKELKTFEKCIASA